MEMSNGVARVMREEKSRETHIWLRSHAELDAKIYREGETECGG